MTGWVAATETTATPVTDWTLELARDSIDATEVIASEHWWHSAGPLDDALAYGDPDAPLSWRRIPVPGPDGVVRFVPVNAITWIEAASQYVRIHVVDRAYLRRGSLSELSRRLPVETFVRIHRGAMVNLQKVAATQREGAERRWAILADGTRLPVSARHWEQLSEALARSSG